MWGKSKPLVLAQNDYLFPYYAYYTIRYYIYLLYSNNLYIIIL